MSSLSVYRRKDCRLCGSGDLELVLKLAPTPPANALLRSEERGQPEPCFPLDLHLCRGCGHVQLLDVVDPEILFRNYVYVSGTSPVFVKHFQDLADLIWSRFSLSSSHSKSFVFELGSNDGTLLRCFQERGARVLGVDPARKIAEAASSQGIPTLPLFFGEDTAKTLVAEQGQAQVVLANNVFAHIDDLAGVTKGIETLLAPNGVFVFEVSYLVDVIQKTLFDTIYHEHLCYHGVAPLVGFFQRHGLELIDVQRVGSHGGSLRGFVQKKGGPWASTQGQKNLAELLALENSMELGRAHTYRIFGENIEGVGRGLRELLDGYHREGKVVAGFGSPAKATTLMHHFGINAQRISYIVDDSPWKQGLYSPGFHVPIVSSDELDRTPPDVLVVLAWNFADSIVEKVDKQRKFREKGGRFVVPLPTLRVL